MISKSIYWFGFSLVLVFSSCSSYRVTANRPEPSTLVKKVKQHSTDLSLEQSTELEGELTFDQALELAFKHNAALGAAIVNIHAAEARTLQAGLYPNPQVDIELENLAGSGPFNRFAGTESTVSLSQPILLGGKRRKQVEKAALLSDLTAWEAERKRLDLYAKVHNAFNKLLIAQEDIALKSELVLLSEKLLETTSERVRAGKVSSAEASRAQIVLAQNKIALAQAHRLLASARQQLTATWGSSEARFSRLVGEYNIMYSLPPEDSLQIRLSQNPDIVRFETAVKHRQAAIALEDAQAIPDPTVSGGIRHLNESRDVALVVGVSIPLPFSNRNQGSREEARHNLAKTEKERQNVQINLSAELSEAYNLFQAIQTEVLTLKEQIIPQAETAYQRINEGYLQGRFDFLDVLDAQRTLFESKDRYLHALREFHETVVRIERLIAQKIH